MATAPNVLVLIVDDIPDSTGHTFDPEGIELPAVEVPIQLGFDPKCRMGYAKLKKGCDGNVYADLDLSGVGTQVDLLSRLTPGIGCVAFETSRVFERLIIDRCRIDRIGLFLGKNADQRIKSLAEQHVLYTDK